MSFGIGINPCAKAVLDATNFSHPFSLTPALSRWGRENVSQRSNRCGVPVGEKRNASLPLPEGEGWGEGEGIE